MGSGAVTDWASMENFADLERKGTDSESPETQRGNGRKNGGSKESGHSLRFSINKFASQFKKSPHRKSASPINWFPRKKTDSFLKRKIRRLQEVGGMNSTLDETLGNANPHYTRMTREKIAAREAARKAMEARKAAMVEASWCRILRAARIQSKEAEREMERAEKHAVEAFEAVRAMGVMMYDMPDSPRRSCEIESSSTVGGGSTHKVTAAFETAFEVDKEVAAAVKRAFIQLANCPSSEKEEFRDLLRKISQNPDSEMDQKMTGMSSEDFDCNNNLSKSSIELVGTMLDRLKGLQENELASLAIIVATCGLNAALLEVESGKDRDCELVTSCSLGSTAINSGMALITTAAKRNSGISRFIDGHMKGKEAATEEVVPSLDKFLLKHVSRLEREVQEARKSNSVSGRRKSLGASKEQAGGNYAAQSDSTTKSSEPTSDLGSILVKHVSKLEKEIQEAKNSQKNSSVLEKVKIIEPSGIQVSEGGSATSNSTESLVIKNIEGEFEKSNDSLGPPTENSRKTVPSFPSDGRNGKENIDFNIFAQSSSTAEMGKEHMPVKHMSRIEKAKLEALKAFSSLDGRDETNEPAGLDKILIKPGHWSEREKTQLAAWIDKSPVKHISRIERAKMEVLEAFSCRDGRTETNEPPGLDRILVKPVCRLEREKVQLLQQENHYIIRKDLRRQGTDATTSESLDKILVKHVSRLEKEKMALGTKEDMVREKKRDQQCETMESLSDILVKHRPEHGKAKLTAARQSEDHNSHVDARREAREREMQEAWGGLSLGNSIRPSLSRLERDKAAWRRAEEEDRGRAGVL